VQKHRVDHPTSVRTTGAFAPARPLRSPLAVLSLAVLSFSPSLSMWVVSACHGCRGVGWRVHQLTPISLFGCVGVGRRVRQLPQRRGSILARQYRRLQAWGAREPGLVVTLAVVDPPASLRSHRAVGFPCVAHSRGCGKLVRLRSLLERLWAAGSLLRSSLERLWEAGSLA
jgi:hypothetical protein